LVDRPELAQNGNLLGVLARKPYAFKDKKPQCFEKIINSSKHLHYLDLPIIVLYFIVHLSHQHAKIDTFSYYCFSVLAVVHVKRVHMEKESVAMKLLKLIWSNIMKLPTTEVDNLLRGPNDTIMKDGKATLQLKKDGRPKYSSRILFVAAEMGNTKFVVELIRKYPDLIWKVNDNNQSIFHVAVSHRHEKIYNLLYEIGSMKDQITPLKDSEGNNMLHLVGTYAQKNRIQDVSGVAFQMQREILWFKVNRFLQELECFKWF